MLIQEEELHHNVTAGVVLSDHSLVLQSITRESAGGYTCMATNVEGRAKSNIVNLEVMCKYVLRALARRREGEPLVKASSLNGSRRHGEAPRDEIPRRAATQYRAIASRPLTSAAMKTADKQWLNERRLIGRFASGTFRSTSPVMHPVMAKYAVFLVSSA